MKNRLFIDIHIIQSVPPSNINRDDTGSPKTAVFGGIRRARVSSQAWKKATRDEFRRMVNEDDIATVGDNTYTSASAFAGLPKKDMVGFRTKHAVALIAESITRIAPHLKDEAEKLATDAIKQTLALKADKEKDVIEIKDGEPQTKYLLFISQEQADKLASLCVGNHESKSALNKKQAKQILLNNNAVDIALFGRMVADDPSLNVDAACQVAHAIGIHKAESEFDYFTALDDCSSEDNAGAGMIGTVEFTSSTLYRYATIDVPHLRENLGGNEAVTIRAIQAFIEAFVVSMPTGKQNTFANRTLPAIVIVQVRDTQPTSLANAFEEAIEAKSDADHAKGRIELAAEALVRQEKLLDKAFGVTPEHTYVVTAAPGAEAAEALGEVTTLPGLLTSLGDFLGAEQS